MSRLQSLFDSTKKILQKIPRHLWLLLAIIAVGIFLRAYNFHDWLEFRNDQSRDAYIVGNVLSGQSAWPLLGPKMNFTGLTDEQSFHLGPMYYHFQIISGIFFGNYPDKFAYPDLFFSVLSIPLLYLFLNLYFKKELSLLVVSFYAISPYFIHFSRFAWNTNLIPFFVLLLLYSSIKFLSAKKENKLWAILMGVSLGIGIQLHAVLMLIFPLMVLVVFFVAWREKNIRWKELFLIFIICLGLNAAQIFYEVRTNFDNSKKLLSFSQQNSYVKMSKLSLITTDLSCHVEANLHFLTSYGNDNCQNNFTDIYKNFSGKNFSRNFENFIYSFYLIIAIIFSITGYYFLTRSVFKEKSEKRHFLIVIASYSLLVFAVMIPLSIEKFNDLRYLIQIFFVPYVLLALIMQLIMNNFTRVSYFVLFLISALLLFLNIKELCRESIIYFDTNKTCSSHSTTLGELEPVARYILSNANESGPLYFGGDKTLPVIFTPLEYLISNHGRKSVDIGVRSNNSQAILDQGFHISCKSGLKDKFSYEKIGNFYVFTDK